MKRKNKFKPTFQIECDFFGFTSDWHICNKYTMEAYILDYLDLLKERGVKQIFHGGDLFEGYIPHTPPLNNLLPGCCGLEEQIKYFNKLIPRKKDLNIKLISGNHLIKGNKGKNVVTDLCARRNDIDYLGRYESFGELKDGVTLEIIHPSRRSPYRRLFKSEEYLNLSPKKPDLLGIGHKHIADYNLCEGVGCYHLGTFLDEPDNRKNKYDPDIGAWIVELKIDGGEIVSNKRDWIGYK